MNFAKKTSLLCPNCRRLISVDEPRCPHCGTVRPGAWWKNNAVMRGVLGGGDLIKAIIVVNVIMFAITLVFSRHSLGLSYNPFAFLSPDSRSLLILGASGTLPILRLHRWWTLISANYLHGGMLHILFNMIALYQIGYLNVQEYGNSRTFIIYTLSGVFGYWVSYLVGVPLTIGASASVCGLIGAALYYGRSRGGVYGQAVYRQVGGWVILIFLFGLLVPGINNWGHGGGIVAGIGLGYLLGYLERRRESLLDKTLAALCLLATAATLIYAVGTGVMLVFG